MPTSFFLPLPSLLSVVLPSPSPLSRLSLPISSATIRSRRRRLWRVHSCRSDLPFRTTAANDEHTRSTGTHMELDQTGERQRTRGGNKGRERRTRQQRTPTRRRNNSVARPRFTSVSPSFSHSVPFPSPCRRPPSCRSVFASRSSRSRVPPDADSLSRLLAAVAAGYLTPPTTQWHTHGGVAGRLGVGMLFAGSTCDSLSFVYAVHADGAVDECARSNPFHRRFVIYSLTLVSESVTITLTAM